jgi:phage/plasmid-associated DNA primase
MSLKLGWLLITLKCIVAAHARILVGNLYEQYVSWCRSSGKHPRSKVQFGKALTSQSYE